LRFKHDKYIRQKTAYQRHTTADPHQSLVADRRISFLHPKLLEIEPEVLALGGSENLGEIVPIAVFFTYKSLINKPKYPNFAHTRTEGKPA